MSETTTTEAPISKEMELIQELRTALELADSIIYDAMVNHNLYPSVSNKKYIEHAISYAKEFAATGTFTRRD